jgi:hypothetical protein
MYICRIRKDKEEKRDSYLALLNQHVISDNHRQLLTSSQSIGQSATLKGLSLYDYYHY